MGCKETKELVIIERPKFWSKMTPTQKEFYETLNALQKKRIAAYTSNTEQWDAFMVLWKGYTKRQK